MITEKDLLEAIAECQGERNPNANTCIKLAAYYTILNQMGDSVDSGHSYDSKPSDTFDSSQTITYDSGSEFSELIQGMDVYDIIPIMDELMQATFATNPPLYKSVIRRLKGQG